MEPINWFIGYKIAFSYLYLAEFSVLGKGNFADAASSAKLNVKEHISR